MKQRTIILSTIAVLLIAVAFIAFRNSSNSRNVVQQNQTISQSPNTVINVFSLSNIKEGDKVAEMTIESITPYDEEAKSIPLENNAKVRFTGQAAITGTYYYECPGFGRECNDKEQRVCFKDLDEASQEKMPMLKDGRNPIWFCFSDANDAKKLLAPTSGKKRVLIDNYTLNVYPSEVIDTADLIKVE